MFGWFRNRSAQRWASTIESELAELSVQIAAAAVERKAAVVGFEEAVGLISAALFRHDPIGINFESNLDEYDAEAESLVVCLISLQTPPTVNQVQTLVNEVMSAWFGAEVGTRPDYADVASEIHSIWTAFEADRSDQ